VLVRKFLFHGKADF